MKTLALCMIVKNEDQHLAACLSSVLSITDEIIILDTGSTDKTTDIAKKYTHKIFNFSWCNDFAAARNAAIEKAESDWILCLDADEVLQQADADKLKRVIQDTPFAAFQFNFKTFTDDENYTDWRPCDKDDLKFCNAKGWFPMLKTTLFRNDKRIRFTGIVHETIEKSLTDNLLGLAKLDIMPLHYGFLKNTDKKNELYISLGKQKIIKEPQNIQAYFELAIHCINARNLAEGEFYLLEILKLEPTFSKAYLELANLYQMQNRHEAALKQLQMAVEAGIIDAHIMNNLGNLYFSKGNYAEAEHYYQKAVALDPTYFKAERNWAISMMSQEQFELAIKQFLNILNKFPNDFITLLNLGFCYTKTGDFEQALTFYDRAEKIDPDHAQLLLNKANNYYRLANKKQALKYYSKVLELTPENNLVKQNIINLKKELEAYL